MIKIIKSSLIIVIITILMCCSLLGQSIQDLQTLQRLLRQNISTTIPEQSQLNVTDKKISEFSNRATIISSSLKYPPKKGNWESVEQYSIWFNETNGDTSVMELYGFTLDTSLIYFGYDLFTQRDSMAYWQYLPAPDNYILGPGDEIEISLWGEVQINNQYTVNRDGNIYIDRVGLVLLSGKSTKEAKTLIANKFKQSFSTLRSKYPSSFIEITFAASKTINVHFVGEVKIPGIHVVHPFSSIVTGLIQAGGVKNIGSLRNIIIKRDGEAISEFDLYDYLINGNIDNNIQLRENDIIVVPIRKSTVEIDGAVYRTGIYEALQKENLKQLIEYAGGLKYNSSGQVTLARIVPLDKRNNGETNIKQFLFASGQLDAIYAQDGDKIQIHSIVKSLNEVRILGQVKRAGIYQYTEDMNILDLLNLAGGLEDSIFIKTMYLDEVEIVRKNEDSEYNKTIKINIKPHLENNTLSEIKIENEDLVIVRKNKNLLSTNNVSIEGEVYRPGVYALKENNEDLKSLITRAGGFTDRAFEEGLAVFRDSLNIIWNDVSFSLIGGDSVFVGQRPGVVQVRGEVYNPGLINYSPGRSLKSYINAAGGLTPDGNNRDILVMYANGKVKPNRLFFHPRVREGATIIVNKKPERLPFSLNQFLRDSASIAASLSMIYYVIQTN